MLPSNVNIDLMLIMSLSNICQQPNHKEVILRVYINVLDNNI